MKPSLLLSWPQVLSEIWASISVSGQTSNLRRAHKQFMTCLKRATRDKKEMRKKTFLTLEVRQLTDPSWCRVLTVALIDDNEADVDVEDDDGDVFCWLPAGEWLPTRVPWSGAARVHDLQPWEVSEHKSSRPFIIWAKSRVSCVVIQQLCTSAERKLSSCWMQKAGGKIS